jgi:serine-type D-Ala-D-Ala endopeptidase (penicillin-binding protein 7)
MLKLKNSILFIFVIASAIYIFTSDKGGIALSDAEKYLVEEKGKVLGVSEEEVGLPVALTETVRVDLGMIAPLVDKSEHKPIKKEGVADISNLSWGSIVAYDLGSREMLFERDAEKQKSIASITKLATALVLMDLKLDWDSVYRMQKSDRIEGGRIYVYDNEEIVLRDLLYTGLVASDNTAMRALVSASGLAYQDFIAAMNEKAAVLGLAKTKFVDPVGISSLNVSTALEVAKLAEAAMQNGIIRDCLLKEKHVFKTVGGVSKTVKNTNILLDNFRDRRVAILGGKTGYTGAAGYCFTAMFVGEDNNKIVTVVLGSESHNSRFNDTERLANWIYSSFEWRR